MANVGLGGFASGFSSTFLPAAEAVRKLSNDSADRAEKQKDKDLKDQIGKVIAQTMTAPNPDASGDAPQQPATGSTATAPAPVAAMPNAPGATPAAAPAADPQLYMADPSKRFNTPLSPNDQISFNKWATDNNRLGDMKDYDMQGAWKAGAGQADNGHFPDTFKKPNHPTFSTESMYANQGNPGQWNGDNFTPTTQTLANMGGQAGAQAYMAQSDPGATMGAEPPANAMAGAGLQLPTAQGAPTPAAPMAAPAPAPAPSAGLSTVGPQPASGGISASLPPIPAPGIPGAPAPNPTKAVAPMVPGPNGQPQYPLDRQVEAYNKAAIMAYEGGNLELGHAYTGMAKEAVKQQTYQSLSGALFDLHGGDSAPALQLLQKFKPNSGITDIKSAHTPDGEPGFEIVSKNGTSKVLSEHDFTGLVYAMADPSNVDKYVTTQNTDYQARVKASQATLLAAQKERRDFEMTMLKEGMRADRLGGVGGTGGGGGKGGKLATPDGIALQGIANKSYDFVHGADDKDPLSRMRNTSLFANNPGAADDPEASALIPVIAKLGTSSVALDPDTGRTVMNRTYGGKTMVLQGKRTGLDDPIAAIKTTTGDADQQQQQIHSLYDSVANYRAKGPDGQPAGPTFKAVVSSLPKDKQLAYVKNYAKVMHLGDGAALADYMGIDGSSAAQGLKTVGGPAYYKQPTRGGATKEVVDVTVPRTNGRGYDTKQIPRAEYEADPKQYNLAK